ncbi:hypothetical protein AUEXF2481DRAFT_6606 [Aureobasidium subglaciale EXF-2481]|uniref:Uncharacterized protein n=1 Tax=Aureobasidium subglaciale (strain EXF-2481) TaxID=1043005 RepID=A0A074Y748_AURSE|nr:uncharacterized protein AUEXF2481DRAFT_6606 [Aureobasidium subglaciale EXF-2481]KAI5212708.1 hypothetical protein E4T38_00157 [Aureobasidium subglaciale]KAI5232524.1 hypothetical protein E4T40_00157 [Aureobasidium subglaciale]KAI5234872.1 hypothetical protein E4T41_00157 [Aureobasidium subglaciale]KAI5268466.1 hypothetical protein E4T46_00157 [Aureobasidium subglaciale]KEQ93530.1 hypothetical protein AUEXF2481DRAFT_6606 [Aureobasidium subglaciale EXF-2481]
MPCRLQPYIWISDDALATAYRRFANTCLVTNSHTNTRRHGSNVPGPLEARRRAARRRMTGLGMASPSPASMPDFGALFGSGAVDTTSLWPPPNTTESRVSAPPHHASPAPPTQWQIPFNSRSTRRRRNASPPPTPPSPQRSLPRRAHSLEELMILLESCDSLDALKREHARLYPDCHLSTTFSKAAFLCLLRQSTPDQVLAFLQSDLDHEESHNTHAYLAHLFAIQSHPEVVIECVALVCDKVALSSIPMSELSDFLAELRHRDDAQSLFEANAMLHNSLVDAYAPGSPPSNLIKKILKNLFSLPPSPDILKLVAEILPLVGLDGFRPMATYLKKALVSETTQPTPSTQLVPILSIIPSEHFDRIVFFATKNFVWDLDTSTLAHVRKDCTDRLVRWLGVLYAFRASMVESSSLFSSLLYPFLASRFTISELGAHFRCLHAADAATIVLHYWIKPSILEVPDPDLDHGVDENPAPLPPPQSAPALLLQPPPTVQSRHGSKLDEPFRTFGLTYTVSRSPEQSRTHCASPSERQAVFDLIASTLEECCKVGGHGVNHSRGGPWVQLFKLLSQNKIEYAGWLDELFQALKPHKSPVWIYYFFAKLVRNRVYIPYPVAIDLIRYFIDIEKTNWALKVFRRPEAHQWLSDVPELLFALVETRPISSGLVFDVLNRPDYQNSLPMNLRSVENNSLSEGTVQLVHHVAYAMAKSELLTSRAAFRRVHDCYNYLKDRGAPVSSIMSRALVHAGVTRPLRDGNWLSTNKFQWILRIVRDLEGDEVADSLDEAAFKLRTENLELASMKPLDVMEREADAIAWEYRKQFRNPSLRRRKTTPPYKPAAPKKTRFQSKKDWETGVDVTTLGIPMEV